MDVLDVGVGRLDSSRENSDSEDCGHEAPERRHATETSKLQDGPKVVPWSVRSNVDAGTLEYVGEGFLEKSNLIWFLPRATWKDVHHACSLTLRSESAKV